MNFADYRQRFKAEAQKYEISGADIGRLLSYAKKLHSKSLPVIYDQSHFSLLVGYNLDYILAMSFSSEFFYKTFSIPKRSGGVRTIEEPMPSLKEVQTWILDNILTPAFRNFVSPVAKAYVPEMSIRENARFHKCQPTVIGIDISDFFPSIDFHKVYTVFNNQMGYTPKLSALLTRLCLNGRHMPQGAPTSPMLSNMIFKDIDDKIFSYCRQNNIRYTRYADDLTFSGEINIAELITNVRTLLHDNGFTLNPRKTKVLHRNASQRVTGIVVNQYLQTPKSYRRRIRQEVYYVMHYGLEEHCRHIHWRSTPRQYLSHLSGKINHALMVNPKDTEMLHYKALILSLICQEASI